MLEGLNENQLKAVTETEGKIRVAAGAGSGKTRVLAARYAYLVEEVGVDPANILCMTFTNKAAQEMRTRIGRMVSSGAHVNDFVCTIHGLCVKVLRREIHRLGYPRNFMIIDEEDAKSFARKAMQQLGIDRTETTVKKFLSAIGGAKSASRQGYVAMLASGNPLPSDSFGTYLQLQQRYFALDFNDLIFFTLYILNRFDDARDYWQNLIDYVEVDEAQDCNSSDWEIIGIMAERSGNIFIVGDPDQAIYEWRGARPDKFMEFDADSTIILDQNYRSSNYILKCANSIINHNSMRIKKDLRSDLGKGDKVVYFHGKSEKEESEWVASQIEEGIQHDNGYEDFAILYRASHLSRIFEQALISREIPYAVWGGIRFFERREIKDALSYLRLTSEGDDLSFERIANVPSRKLGEKSMEALRRIAEEENSGLFDALSRHLHEKPFADKPALRQFVSLISKARTLSAAESISSILEMLMKESGLLTLYRDDGDEDRLENLTELMASIKQYESTHSEDDISLADYLQDIALYTNADYKQDSHRVRLMTLHQAKGLEFKNVFIVGLTEGIFPSHRSIRERRQRGEEEERRLMYVGVTRGMKRVYLTESEGQNFAAKTSKYPSRFLSEIDSDAIEIIGEIDPALAEGTQNLVKEVSRETDTEPPSRFEPGNLVMHKLFGKGIVVENHPERSSCRVEFESRTVNLRYMALAVLGSRSPSES